MMDRNDPASQASRIGDGTIAGKDQSGPEYSQEARNHTNNQPWSQEGELSNELALARKHNAALPIQALPVEIFLHVFRLHMFPILDNESHKDYYPRLIDISGVCAHWYKLIQNSPPLWTLIGFSDPLWVVEMALQRSSGHPLDIVMRDVLSYNPPNLRPFMGAISPHKNRWHKIDIKVRCPLVKDIVEALGGPPPNLKELSFVDRNTHSCTRELNLFTGRAPSLNKLTLNGVSIPWDSEILHNLTALDLSWISFPSTEVILRALTCSPQLQKLRIRKCSTRLMATASSPFVQLSQLVHLYVQIRGRAEMKNFLDHLICSMKDEEVEELLGGTIVQWLSRG